MTIQNNLRKKIQGGKHVFSIFPSLFPNSSLPPPPLQCLQAVHVHQYITYVPAHSTSQILWRPYFITLFNLIKTYWMATCYKIMCSRPWKENIRTRQHIIHTIWPEVTPLLLTALHHLHRREGCSLISTSII